eukprot:CAMPEP_0181408538 /NCGR_PEP_ID=MMETSP1110-20121109/6351_1 /TAXON_ID=174948 /ORGANISM="Symbiodinium sp., Strain CCMP421" /LENGTH=538 /DNA_ID=CAMNT_0023531009 /DNA_START=81 /DNA_END=1697 /DNA_ORIENTATION=+
MVAEQAPEPSFPRAGTEIISEGDMLSALPVPRCSSEVIKPSELFLDLMMLDPLKRELSPVAGGKSATPASPTKPVQRPSSRSQPKVDSPKGRLVAVLPQEAKPIIDWGQMPQPAQPVQAPARAPSASMKLPNPATAGPPGPTIPPTPTGFTPLPVENYRLTQPINRSVIRSSGLISSMQREVSPTGSPSKVGAISGSYSLQLPPKASYPQVPQQSLLQPTLAAAAQHGSPIPLTALASSLAAADKPCFSQPSAPGRSVAVPLGTPRTDIHRGAQAQPCWPSAPATLPAQYRQITIAPGAQNGAQLLSGARAWVQPASPTQASRVPMWMTHTAPPAQGGTAHEKALPRTVASAGLAETAATAAPAQHEVQTKTPGPTARLPLSANARSPVSVPTHAPGPGPAPAAPAPAVPLPAAPAPAAPAPAAATYVTATGGCQWRTLNQPCQYQAYPLQRTVPAPSAAAAAATLPLQRASLPVPHPHSQAYRLTTPATQQQSRPVLPQAPFQLSSAAPHTMAMQPTRPGLGAAEVAQRAAAWYPLP